MKVSQEFLEGIGARRQEQPDGTLSDLRVVSIGYGDACVEVAFEKTDDGWDVDVDDVHVGENVRDVSDMLDVLAEGCYIAGRMSVQTAIKDVLGIR